jgi:hypothetical protein
MRGFLAEHLGVFDPDDIQILVTAFDKAWEAVRASGVVFDTKDKADTARAILAKHIIAAAKDGERDEGRLRDGALVALAQSNLSSAPWPLR